MFDQRIDINLTHATHPWPLLIRCTFQWNNSTPLLFVGLLKGGGEEKAAKEGVDEICSFINHLGLYRLNIGTCVENVAVGDRKKQASVNQVHGISGI